MEEQPTYCVGECTCGNDCHNNADFHLTFTTWNGQYPQLLQEVDQDLLATALEILVVTV